jgi:hypothetical protein
MSDSNKTGEANLLAQIDTLIAFFEHRRSKLRRWDRTLFLLQAILTFLTTLAAGLHITGQEVTLKEVALVTSSLASLVALAAGRFAYREQWIAYTETSSNLHAIRSRIQLLMSLAEAGQRPKLTADEIVTLHAEMQAILNRVDDRWLKSVSVAQSTPRTPAAGSKASQ